MSEFIIYNYAKVQLYKTGANSMKQAIEKAVASNADLRYANLYNANLSNANLYNANLSNANLRYADLSNPNLRYANLSNADLSNANLRYADLSNADLRYADLSNADLRYADLSNADLSYPNLDNADLRYAKGITPAKVQPLLMLYDQVGKIRSYKLVDAQNQGPFRGGIAYELDKSYEVLSADTNVELDCGEGINLATLDWCLKNLPRAGDGARILIAEFTAKDIAAIPTSSDGKFRVFRCKIVGEKDLNEFK